MQNTQQNIVKILAYFDIFHYPLVAEEMRSFLPGFIEDDVFITALSLLVVEKMVFKFDDFYSLQNNKLLIDRRRNGNKLAERQMVTAFRAAAILSHFPYVRSLAISGSLSKNFADERTDIDFFIITSANRLWIARTIMHVFKKLSFIVGKQNWFCMNYYIDEAAMEIKEQNIFTAMEVVTLIPVYNDELFSKFIENNKWVKSYFPIKKANVTNIVKVKANFFKQLVEKIFNNKSGDKIDNSLMKLTDKRWQKKTEQKRVNEKGIRMSMQAGKHFSKPDPKNFQQKVIQEYENKLKQFNTICIQKIVIAHTAIFSSAAK